MRQLWRDQFELQSGNHDWTKQGLFVDLSAGWGEKKQISRRMDWQNSAPGIGTEIRVLDPAWHWPDPDPTSQDKPDPDPDLTSQDKPDPDPDTSVLKIFHLFYDEF